MTTAHRPTWSAAKVRLKVCPEGMCLCQLGSCEYLTVRVIFILLQGGEEQGGMRFYAPSQMRSVKDATAYTKMKYRKDGQGSIKELMEKDMKAKLEEKEQEHFSKLSREEFICT